VLVVVIVAPATAAVKVWDGSDELWTNAAHWLPAGAPTTNDTAVVPAGMAVVLHANGACHMLVVSNGGFAIVNEAGRTLTVASNACVAGAGSQGRVNAGLLKIGATAFATNGGAAVIDGGTLDARDIEFGTGTLVWHSGTLTLRDDVYIQHGASLQARTIVAGQTLEVASTTLMAAEPWIEDSGVLTLDGGFISCDGLQRTAAGTFHFHDGTLLANGADFVWGNYNVVLESDTPAHNPQLVLNGYYFPGLDYAMTLATSVNRRASLTLTGMTRLRGNGTIAGGAGARAEVLVTGTSEWQPQTLVLGGSGAGTLTINDNSDVINCQALHIAQSAGSTGILTVTDATWGSYWETHVGEAGLALVTVTNGGVIEFLNQAQDTHCAQHGGSEARVTVAGAGSQLKVEPDANPHTIYFGESGRAMLVVSNGANVSMTEHTRCGSGTSGRADVLVSGPGSLWHVNDDVWFGYQGMATMHVLDGATALWSYSKLGEFPGGGGTVVVSGPGSYWSAGGAATIGLEFLVGRYGVGTVLITNGGVVHSSGYSELGQYDGSSGSVTVTGLDSMWIASGTLAIGATYSQHITGTVMIANGGRVQVQQGTTIGLSGTLTGDGGTLAGAVTSHGHIRPGSSPGTLTIEGGVTLMPNSTIHLELAGTTAGLHDHLAITGHTAVAGTLSVTLDGYTPVYGDSFDVFDWGGGVTGTFGTLLLPPLSGSLVWNTAQLYTSGELRVTPEPLLLVPLLLVAGTFRRVRQ
jgi:T5SS/PEP-CTERM-associated repeat protein